MIENCDEHDNAKICMHILWEGNCLKNRCRTFKERKKREEIFQKELYHYLKVVLGMEDDLTEEEKKEMGIE